MKFFRLVLILLCAVGIFVGCKTRLEDGELVIWEGLEPTERLDFVKGLYLWSSVEVITDIHERAKFFEFCKANKINLVAIYIAKPTDDEAYLVKYKDEYKKFLTDCKHANIQTYALTGEVVWLNKYDQVDLNGVLKSYIDFNSKYSDNFRGIFFDIEPQQLAGWEINQHGIISDYLALLDKVTKNVGRDKIIPIINLQYAHDLYYYKGHRQNFLKLISDRVDSIAVMSYYNKGYEVEKRLLPILSLKDLKVKVYGGLETNKVNIRDLSFFGEGLTTLNVTVGKIDHTLSAYDNYLGLIINDYQGMSKLRKR